MEGLPWHGYIMAILYIAAGLNHFRIPRIYAKMIPPLFPYPQLLNKITGFLEIALGILLCIPQFSTLAAWGIIGLLVIIFPANVYMLLNEKAALGLTKWIRFIRLPLQLVLIYWAFLYT